MYLSYPTKTLRVLQHSNIWLSLFTKQFPIAVNSSCVIFISDSVFLFCFVFLGSRRCGLPRHHHRDVGCRCTKLERGVHCRYRPHCYPSPPAHARQQMIHCNVFSIFFSSTSAYFTSPCAFRIEIRFVAQVLLLSLLTSQLTGTIVGLPFRRLFGPPHETNPILALVLLIFLLSELKSL